MDAFSPSYKLSLEEPTLCSHAPRLTEISGVGPMIYTSTGSWPEGRGWKLVTPKIVSSTPTSSSLKGRRGFTRAMTSLVFTAAGRM